MVWIMVYTMKNKIIEQYTDKELDESFCRDVANIPYEYTEKVDIDSRCIYEFPPPSFCHNYIGGELWKQLNECERYELFKQGKLYTIRLYENSNVYEYRHETVGRAVVIAFLKKEYKLA
jgi:hypothetical protein